MKTAVIIKSEFLGSGSDELGQKLMGSYLRKLWSLENRPQKILFYNAGVKLLAEGSEVLDALNGLFENGVDLVACGTCISFFELKEKIAVGRVGDMHEIVTTMLEFDKVITV